ncbi:hypothetical protein PVAND_015810 [Polypedilum vanderplanki]|uniref:Chitin-binding type-2 domain-containing protein n=1 Tax=Polypedilum vanderplanki TaxID=319348 RepID=A0A9J6BD83_POLVA|nr:hypothetical protein PVAND_015810 [Polypedilum vanderplanki]
MNFIHGIFVTIFVSSVSSQPSFLIETPLTYNEVAAICQRINNGGTVCASTPGCDVDNRGQYYSCNNGLPTESSTPGDLSVPLGQCAPNFYCYNNRCTPNSPICQLPPFTCPGEGNFPDPSDCLRYYNCAYDMQSDQYNYKILSCKKGFPFYPYSADGSPCRRGGSNYCITTTCRPGITEWRPLNYFNGTEDQYAVFCQNGQFSFLGACEKGLSIDINDITTTNCIVKCKRNNQKAVYVADKRMFYLCMYGQFSLETCPDNKNFDANTMSCI